MSAELVRRRRLVAGAVLAAAIAVAVVLTIVLGGSSGPAISQRAATLVPESALVFAHLSTDGDRAAVADGQQLAEGFPSFERARRAVLSRLVVPGEDAESAAVASWLGDELALALLDAGTGTAQSLALLAVDDEEQARAFLARATERSGPAQEYRGVRIDRVGASHAALVDGFLALGPRAAVRGAVDLSQGTGEALAGEATFAALRDRLPEDRVAAAYATADGLRRLLVPAGGAYAIAGVLLDRPNLAGTAVSLSAEEPGARLTVVSRVPERTGKAFEPTLAEEVPADALAYLGTQGLDETATRLAAMTGTEQLAELVVDLRDRLGEDGAATVQRDLLDLLREETALVLLPGIPAPVPLVIARTDDEDATRAALERLTASLPELLEGAEVAQEGDVTVVSTGETEVRAAVFDGKLVLSTSQAGIDAARDPGDGLAGTDAFETVVPDGDGPVTAVVFLDFSQLLRLGEQTGLNDSRAYLAVKPDLARVRSVGARSTGGGEDTTTEIRVSIP